MALSVSFSPETPYTRVAMRNMLTVPLLLLAMLFLAACTTAEGQTPEVVMYKSPTCGCCEKWAEHLEANGFDVRREDRNDLTPVKMQHGIPYELGACHTATVGDYVVEGHVPADVIKRMLEEKPDIRGITVPGMPIGSPGMEGPNPQSYDILALKKDGTTEVYATR